MTRKLRDSVVVITGASSGIGRAAALAFAREGATLVLGARRGEQLEQVAEECRTMGVLALAVPVDVTDEAAVQHLAQQAIESYGRLDVWINNAAVSLFGRIEEVPMDQYRRVVETNLFGYVHGARAAIPHFRKQRSGVLINNSSVFGTMGAPYLSAYVSTKFAIRGLSESLRQELLDVPGIHVCTVMPASIDTPIFNQAANYTGRAIQPLKPILPAEDVAQAMVHLARSPQRELIVGTAGRMQKLVHSFIPRTAEKLNARQVDHDHFQDGRPADPSPGNLYEPMPQWGTISGGWRNGEERKGRGGAIAVGAIAFALSAGLILYQSLSRNGAKASRLGRVLRATARPRAKARRSLRRIL